MRKPNARDRILETASRLFFKRGYSEVGINEIIDKADTAKASFYQHFPSKEALCEAWLSAVHERSECSRTEILESDATAVEKIDLYFQQLEQFMKQSDFRGCPYSNTGALASEGCEGIVDQIQSHKKSIREFFRGVCHQQLQDREKADRLGDRIFLLYSGATTECQNLQDLWPVREARAAALGLVLN
jgi:AcrR family transcriptional regulator